MASYASTVWADSVYVPDTLSDSVAIIDQASGLVVATVPTGSHPGQVVISPSGGRGYVANSMGNSVTVFDTITYQVLATVLLPHSALALAISPNNARVYVTGSDTTGTRVTAIDTSSNSIVSSSGYLTSPLTDLAVSPDSTRVYAVDTLTFKTIDATTLATLSSVAVGAGYLKALVLSPDGTRAYLIDAGASFPQLIVVGTANGVAASTTGLTYVPEALAISLDGQSVYVAADKVVTGGMVSNIAVMATASNTVVANIAGTSGYSGIAVSPDGSKVYASDDANSAVQVIDAASRAVTAQIYVGKYPARPATARLTPHNVLLYLHSTDVASVNGSYAMTSTPVSAPGLSLNLLNNPSWASDTVFSGSFSTGSTFQLSLPCVLGLGVGVTYTLAKTDASGGHVVTLGTGGGLLSLCLLGSQVVTIPVSSVPVLNGERLKLSIASVLGLNLPLAPNNGAVLQATQFIGSP
ncbi:YncE family protein [Dyella silvatica]|uniref:YncE family protein n=1 Tax=Dyella silvatica TaxID=2992128 RepID=UPI00225932AD|nr:YncE family protein [Dyella silvatica]